MPTKTASTPDGIFFDSPKPSHAEWVGRIIVRFTQLEGEACTLFERYSGLDTARSRCITGHLRLRQTMEIVSTPVRTTQPDDRLTAAFNSLKDEINRLSSERDKIAHWEWFITPDGPGVGRFLTVKATAQTPTIKHYTTENLPNLTQTWSTPWL